MKPLSDDVNKAIEDAALSSGEILQKYADRLRILLERKNWEGAADFALNQPSTLTVKTRTGQYRKHPMIGGEVFAVSSAYMGKTGKIIVVFTPRDTHIATKYGFMEMTVDEARKGLDGFASFMDRLLGEDFDEQVASYKAEAKAKEQQAYIETKEKQYGESLGSW